MKVLAELKRKPLKINIETQVFKYLQTIPFLDTEKFLYQAFQERINFEKQFEIGRINLVK